MWSVKLIKLINGFGNVSFTDAWTLYIEKIFAEKYKLNLTYFTDKPIIYRNLNESIDGENSIRWSTSRKNNFTYMNSEEFHELTQKEITTIINHVKMHPKSWLKYKLRFYFCSLRNHVQLKMHVLFGQKLKYISLKHVPSGQPFLLFSIFESNIILYRNKCYLAPFGLTIDFSDDNFMEKYGSAIRVYSSLAPLYTKIFNIWLRKVFKGVYSRNKVQ